MTSDGSLSTNNVTSAIHLTQAVLKPVWGEDKRRVKFKPDQAQRGRDSEMIATRQVVTQQATFWIDLKREGKPGGRTFVKLTERNKRGRSKIFIGGEDVPEFLQCLKAPRSNRRNPSVEPYAEFNSKMYTTKTFYFSMLYAFESRGELGQKIQVTDVANINDDKSNERVQCHVFIHMTELDEILQAIESLMSDEAKTVDSTKQINEQLEYVAKDSHYTKSQSVASAHVYYMVRLGRERGGRHFVALTSKATGGPNKGTHMHLNIGLEDMPEFIKHLKNAASRSMDNPLCGPDANTQFDSKVFNNTFCFATADDSGTLKLTKRYPVQQLVQSAIRVLPEDVDKLVITIEKVLPAGKTYMK